MSSFDDGIGRQDGNDEGPAASGVSVPPFDLAGLADALPSLGSVLWLEHRGAACAGPSRATTRGVVLIEHPAVAPLARCTDMRAYQAITPGGPREWLEFRASAGEPLAKLFLLPDTDYLAWDELTACCGVAPASPSPSHGSAHAAFVRGALARLGATWLAHVLSFDLRRRPWLRMLGARTPLRLSLLGMQTARTIAHAEGAGFASSLHG